MGYNVAQTLDIIVKIRQIGLEIITDLNSKIKVLNNTINQTSAAPFVEIAHQIKAISNTVQNLERFAQDVITGLAKQTIDRADSTISRVNDNLNSAIETFMTRVGVAVAGTFVIAQTQFGNKLLVMLLAGRSAMGSLLATGTIIFQELAASSTQFFAFVFTRFASLQTNVALFVVTVNSLLDHTASLVLGIARGSLPLISHSFAGLLSQGFAFTAVLANIAAFSFLTILPAKIFLTEATALFKRLIGHGEASLTPLQRIMRLVTTLDIAVHAIGLTGGQLFKTFLFGTAALWGPFSGFLMGIPALNSAITSIIRLGERLRLQVFAFFGSSRAQVGLLFFDLKNALPPVLKAARMLSESFIKIVPNASKAAKVIGKIGPDASLGLSALAKTKLPFAAQFQELSLIIKVFLKEMLVRITAVSLTLSKVFKLSQNEVTALGTASRSATQIVSAGLQTSINTLIKASQTGFLGRLLRFGRGGLPKGPKGCLPSRMFQP